jgi:hypothetical protein
MPVYTIPYLLNSTLQKNAKKNKKTNIWYVHFRNRTAGTETISTRHIRYGCPNFVCHALKFQDKSNKNGFKFILQVYTVCSINFHFTTIETLHSSLTGQQIKSESTQKNSYETFLNV